MKKTLLLLALALGAATSAHAQLVFYSFGPNAGGFTTAANESLLTGTPTFVQSGVDIVPTGAAGTGFTDASGTSWAAGQAAGWTSGVNDPAGNSFSFSFDSTGFEDFLIRFSYRATSTGPASFSSIQYNVNGGAFSALSGASATITNDGIYNVWSFDASALSSIENSGNIVITWAMATTGTGSGTFNVDNFQLTGVAAPIPEPSSLVLMGLGTAFLLYRRPRRA